MPRPRIFEKPGEDSKSGLKITFWSLASVTAMVVDIVLNDNEVSSDFDHHVDLDIEDCCEDEIELLAENDPESLNEVELNRDCRDLYDTSCLEPKLPGNLYPLLIFSDFFSIIIASHAFHQALVIESPLNQLLRYQYADTFMFCSCVRSANACAHPSRRWA